VGPCSGQATHVDGLPSGQRGSIGQDSGELSAPVRAQGVVQAGGEVDDVGFQFRRDCGCAEPAVEQADGVGFLLQNLDDRGVDVAGAGDLAQQLALLAAIPGGRFRIWAGARNGLGGDAEQDAGMFGHVEAVGDPGVDGQGLDCVLVRTMSLTRP
jgi:hypothetical protein